MATQAVTVLHSERWAPTVGPVDISHPRCVRPIYSDGPARPADTPRADPLAMRSTPSV